MHMSDLIEDFVRRYHCKPEEVQVFFSGTGLDLLGGFPAEIGGNALSAALSAGTYAAVRLRNTEEIQLQKSESNLVYNAKLNTLAMYQDKNWAKPVFHALAILQTAGTPMSGAEVLLHYDLSEPQFEQTIPAVLSAVNQQHAAPVQLFHHCLFEQIPAPGAVLAGLAGKAHTLLFSNTQSGQHTYLSSPFAGFNVILVTPEEKQKKDIMVPFLKAWEILQEKNPFLTTAISLTNDDIAVLNGTPEYPYAKFILEEQARINQATALLNKRQPDADGFWSVLHASGEALHTLCSKSVPESALLYTLATQSGQCAACRILNSGHGIFAVVRTGSVDSFLENLRTAFTEKAGSSPTFSVCAIAGSGFCPPPPKPISQ